MTIHTRIKSLLSRPRSIINSILLAIFAAMLVREVLYWLPRDISADSLNYWASSAAVSQAKSGAWFQIRSRR